MRQSRRHDLLLAAAVTIILGTLAVYVSLIVSWFEGKPQAAAVLPQPEKPDAERALARARAVFRQDILDPRAALKLSQALLRSGRAIDAFYVADWARGFYPPQAFARAHDEVVLGRAVLAGAEDAPPSLDELQARLKDEPDNPAVLAELARLTVASGDATQAQKYVDEGLAARPDDAPLMLLKAELTLPTSPVDAVGYWARAANQDPASYEGKKALQKLGELAGKPEDSADGDNARLAREALEELVKAKPAAPGPFMTLALALWARGDSAPTRALVAQEMAKRKINPGAFAVQGALDLNDGRPDDAVKDFTKAWDNNPDDLFTAGKLAQLFYKEQGDGEAALPFYVALYLNDPDYADGEPAETIIKSILDTHRQQGLAHVTAEGLGRYLSSDDASLRAEACVRVAQLKDPRWIDALAELLDDDTEIVRHDADYALYQLAKQFPDAVRVRRDDWLAENRPLMRARVLNLFADLYPGETYPLALQALHDPNPGLRYQVKTLIMDRYYSDIPAAAKAVKDYLAQEKDPRVLAMYAQVKPAQAAR